MSAQRTALTNPSVASAPRLTRAAEHWIGSFVAMACPCEVLIEECTSEPTALAIVHSVARCAWSIEQRYSRYRNDNIIHRINTANGAPTEVDDESANLLDFAARLTDLSEGAFDVTSGVLRKVWIFDGGDRIPTADQIDGLRNLIGWDKVVWRRPVLKMKPQMQIDLGGIGKEYAVDRAVEIANTLVPGVSCLINFGGDIAVRTPRSDGKPWVVGIESIERPNEPYRSVALRSGAIATSGDSRRFLLKDGKRYSHVLDARTGRPVPDAPHSVTVQANTCIEAGTFSTLALLHGIEAEPFLRDQGVRFWLQ